MLIVMNCCGYVGPVVCVGLRTCSIASGPGLSVCVHTCVCVIEH